MEYNNLRNKIGKFYSGGKIPKYQVPAGPITADQQKRLQDMNDLMLKHGLSMEQSQQLYNTYNGDLSAINTMFEDNLSVDEMLNTGAILDSSGNEVTVNSAEIDKKEARQQKRDQFNQKAKDAFMGVGKQLSGVDFSNLPEGMSEGAAMGIGIAAKAGTAAFNAIDQATMGDKNFGAQSQAIDSAVHGVSGALMSSGNPYAMAAGAALEGVNFLTKAGGQTVQGYDVNIENSGFGNLGHQESSSSRSFLFGLGDITGKKIQAKLARRNEQARMALQAAEISEDVKFEQEARMNSVDNVLRNNQIALAGGIDTSLLGS